MILKFRLVLGFGLLLSGSDFYLRVLTFNLGFGLLFEGPGHYFRAPTIIVSSDYYFRIRTTTLGLGLPFWDSNHYFRVRTSNLRLGLLLLYYVRTRIWTAIYRVRATISGFGLPFALNHEGFASKPDRILHVPAIAAEGISSALKWETGMLYGVLRVNA